MDGQIHGERDRGSRDRDIEEAGPARLLRYLEVGVHDAAAPVEEVQAPHHIRRQPPHQPHRQAPLPLVAAAPGSASGLAPAAGRSLTTADLSFALVWDVSSG